MTFAAVLLRLIASADKMGKNDLCGPYCPFFNDIMRIMGSNYNYLKIKGQYSVGVT